MTDKAEASDLDTLCSSLLADLKPLPTAGPEGLAMMLNAISWAFIRAGHSDVGGHISRRATYAFAMMVGK